jgi:hypothetical protein
MLKVILLVHTSPVKAQHADPASRILSQEGSTGVVQAQCSLSRSYHEDHSTEFEAIDDKQGLLQH